MFHVEHLYYPAHKQVLSAVAPSMTRGLILKMVFLSHCPIRVLLTVIVLPDIRALILNASILSCPAPGMKDD